jgi:hypothetical protein
LKNWIFQRPVITTFPEILPDAQKTGIRLHDWPGFCSAPIQGNCVKTNSSVDRPWLGALVGGLCAGALDISAAIVVYGLMRGGSATSVLQSVASGWLGMKAFDGDGATAALGLFFQFFIALTAATVYHVASRKLKWLVHHAFIFGPLYGIAVYYFMNLIVVPLSAFPFKLSRTPGNMLTGLTIHIFCVGLPIALANRWYAPAR